MHLYTANGEPVYKVPYADKKRGLRDATLRDAKKMGLFPSVTEVLRILDKPGLNRWKETQVLESALTLPRGEKESDKEYMARIRKDATELSISARDEGTRIHDALESCFKNRVVPKQYRSLTESVRWEVMKHFDLRSGWVAEQSFGHGAGYGGKVDLYNENGIVIDFKTKEKLKPKMAFDEHLMQLTAYRQGLLLGNARLANVFVDYDGNVEIYEWTDINQITRCHNMFMACLKLWKLQKDHDPISGKVAA